MAPAIEQNMRSRPSAEALQWVQGATGGRVTSVRPLSGGQSSAVHVLSVQSGAATQRLVLRCFVHAQWLAAEPDVGAHEAAVLRLLGPTDIPAPRLIAVDEYGAAAGVPSVLMTFLPGRVHLMPGRIDDWLKRMADALPAIHGIRPAPTELPWAYAPYTDPPRVQVPAWASRRAAWQEIIEFACGPRPASDTHLVHRDYHPANILWQRGHIAGIVDWVNACRGPAGVDIGHCRRNLAILHGVAVADRFLEHCLEWADYNPYWDILSLLDAELDEPVYEGWLDLGVTLAPAAAHARLDEYAVSLARRLQD